MQNNKEKLISGVFQYVITAMRSHSISNEFRNNKLKTTKRKIYFYYRMGLPGFLLYCLNQVFKSTTVKVFNNGIIDDHASGVIRNAVMRTTEINIEDDCAYIKINRVNSFRAFFLLFGDIIRSYKKVRPDSLIEFARCANISVALIKYFYFIQRNKPDFIFIADTTDPKRMALGIIAELQNIPLYVFSVVRHGARTAHPFRVNTYFCWTKEQEEYLRSNTGSDVVVMSSPIKAMRRLEKNGNYKFGLLLNAKYRHEEVEKFLDEIYQIFGLKDIQIRPHPSKHNKNYIFTNGILRDPKEQLSDFFKSIDCVFAPNTNAMIEALLNGVPVIHVHYLGEGGFDMQGLVEKGLVMPYSLMSSLPDSVNDFYCENNYNSSIEYLNTHYCGSYADETAPIRTILKK